MALYLNDEITSSRSKDPTARVPPHPGQYRCVISKKVHPERPNFPISFNIRKNDIIENIKIN